MEAWLLLLQLWGGGLYLLNKIFFSFAERTEAEVKRYWKIWAWIVYLAGTPAVIGILAYKHNWIFAGLEIGGIPSMILGLMIALRGRGREAKWLDAVAVITIVAGFAYSVFDFGGLTTITQALEIVAVVTFLIGTYMLAKENGNGYLYYVLMHISTGTLLWIEHLPWFTLQQIISLVFILDAYRIWNRKHKAPVSS